MYANPDFKTKKALKAAVANGETVTAYSPGPFGAAIPDGLNFAEGPHAPKPHTWYAQVWVENGLVVRVIA